MLICLRWILKAMSRYEPSISISSFRILILSSKYTQQQTADPEQREKIYFLELNISFAFSEQFLSSFYFMKASPT